MTPMPCHRRLSFVGGGRHAFTLMEVVLVAALVAMFSAMAVISIQQIYDSNKRKTMLDETRSIGVALNIARDDVGFYPRICMLGKSLGQVAYYTSAGTQFSTANPTGGSVFVLPMMDTYGYLNGVDRASEIASKWQAPYTAISEVRKTFAQGSKLLCKMRLPETRNVQFNAQTSAYWMGTDVSLVDWPTDIWGNPYMVYLVKSDSALMSATGNPYGLRLIKNAMELPDYWAAVVSYGPNGIPGGTSYAESRDLISNTAYINYVDNTLKPAKLYAEGDSQASGATYTSDGTRIYTLRSACGSAELSPPTTVGGLELNLTSNATFSAALPGSITSASSGMYTIGIRDSGSDDLFWVF